MNGSFARLRGVMFGMTLSKREKCSALISFHEPTCFRDHRGHEVCTVLDFLRSLGMIALSPLPGARASAEQVDFKEGSFFVG